MQLLADPGAFGKRRGASAGRAGAEVTQRGEGRTTPYSFDELPSAVSGPPSAFLPLAGVTPA